MDVFQEHLERYQDPLIESFRDIALKVAQKYTPKYVKNMKFELNLDKQKKDVIISMLTINL